MFDGISVQTWVISQGGHAYYYSADGDAGREDPEGLAKRKITQPYLGKKGRMIQLSRPMRRAVLRVLRGRIQDRTLSYFCTMKRIT